MKIVTSPVWARAAAMSALLLSLGLAGCGIGNSAATVTGSPGVVPAGISGHIHGGQQPVTGATIQLYQVGTSGYNAAAQPLLTTAVASDLNGNFNITNDYSCATNSYVYITASGGQPATGVTNPNLALMAVLGSCSTLKANAATTFITINEITTVAGAYALAQFSGGSAFGTALSAQGGVAGSTAPADNFATSSTNTQGLINAMNVASVLANDTTGTSPGSNANGTAVPEWWQINTIANIMAACINSSGLAAGENLSAPTTNCGEFFGNVAIPSGTNPATGRAYAAPADTLQAAVYLALSPGLTITQISTLYGLAAATAPFQPYVTSAASIKDFSVAITYNPIPQGSGNGPSLLTNGNSVATTGTTVGTTQPSMVAIDSYGNAWVYAYDFTKMDGTSGLTELLELDPTGNPIPQGTTCTAPCVASNYITTSYNSGTAIKGGENIQTYIIPQFALDTNNNVWFGDYQGQELIKIPGSTSAGGVNGGNAAATGIAAPGNPVAVTVDGANNVYYSANSSEGAQSTTCTNSWGTNKSRGLYQYVPGSTPVQNYLGPLPTYTTTLAVDGGTSASAVDYDSTGGSAITGSPFIWALANNNGSNVGVGETGGSNSGTIGQFYTTGTTPCGTPLSAGTSTYGITPQTGVLNPATNAAYTTNGTPTTQIAAQIAAGTDATVFMGNPVDIAFDNNGNMFVSNDNYTDSNKTSQASFSKVSFNYSNGFTPSAVGAATTFTNFNATSGGGTNYGGMQKTGDQPHWLSIDGAGDVWTGLGSGAGLGAFTNSGTPISPNTNGGFIGSTCSSCTFNGITGSYSRDVSSIYRLAVDGSGNIWMPVNGQICNVTAYSITNNVITFTTSTTPTIPLGKTFTVKGLSTGTFLNNLSFTLTASTATSLTANFTYPNTASTTDSGTATWGAVVVQVGTAVPVVTPLATGLANHTLATKP